MNKLIFLSFIIILTGCGGKQTQLTNEVAVDKANFNGKWALSVNSGTIGCDDNAVYMVADDGNTYALNGTAQTRSKSNGKGWVAVDRDSTVWLDNPNITGSKIDMSDMIAVGLKLCEE